MRKLILNVACSLDGYIAGSRGDIDWLLTDADHHITFMDTIDLILMGRKTFDFIKSLGTWPYGNVAGHVFSRSLQTKSHADHITWVSEEVGRHISALKKSEGKDIWLLGGGEIVKECLSHALVDEMVLSVHPILLGKGIPLFPPGYKMTNWKLKKTESFPSGLVQLSYRA